MKGHVSVYPRTQDIAVRDTTSEPLFSGSIRYYVKWHKKNPSKGQPRWVFVSEGRAS